MTEAKKIGRPLAKPRKNSELENSLEEYFWRSVRAKLHGRMIKLVPVETGTPDRLVFLPGGIMKLVELKTTTGDLSEAQKFVHGRLADLGITVDVLGGREEVDAWIEAQRPSDTPLIHAYGAAGYLVCGLPSRGGSHLRTTNDSVVTCSNCRKLL